MELVKARLNSSFLVIWPSATIVFVTVVPMFAPITMGIAHLIESAPPATKPTTIEVVVEELCIMLVAKRPINKPMIGFDVVCISLSLNASPKHLKLWLIREMLTKKIYSNIKIRNILVTLSVSFFMIS